MLSKFSNGKKEPDKSSMVVSEMKNSKLKAPCFTRELALIEKQLDRYLCRQEPVQLREAMRYSALNGGKRMRALLVFAAASACGGDEDIYSLVLPCACAVELVHTMSLIHDDLPCMDNDDFRRGKPANHKVFGEALALLAGDALLMSAVEILLAETPKVVPPDKVMAATIKLSRAAGAPGMVGGQVDDLILTGFERGDKQKHKISKSLLESLHGRKTGALIQFAAWAGANLVGANQVQLAAIEEFATALGLAFQISDDLLDVTGDAPTLGKTPGKDEAGKKATWVTVFGIDESLKQLTILEETGRNALRRGGFIEASRLRLELLLKSAIHRNK